MQTILIAIVSAIGLAAAGLWSDYTGRHDQRQSDP